MKAYLPVRDGSFGCELFGAAEPPEAAEPLEVVAADGAEASALFSLVVASMFIVEQYLIS